MTIHGYTAKVLLQYIKPLVEKGKIPSYDFINPDKLKAVIKCAYDKKICDRTLRRWIADRVLEEKHSNSQINNDLDWLEIKAMEELPKGSNTTLIAPIHVNDFNNLIK